MKIYNALWILLSVSAFMRNADKLSHDIKNGVKLELLQNCDTTPDDRRNIWTKVQSILSEKGEYAVGRSGFFGTERGSIAWSNPTTSFGLISFFEPRNEGPVGWSDYLISHNLTNVWLSANGFMSNASFFLSRQDAMVWMGCTPPVVRYFHMRTFSAVHQWGDYEPHSPMAGLGDTVNQANINTTGGANGADPWNKTAVIITTADADTYEHIASAFEQAGIPRTAINTDVLPSSDWIKFLDDAPDSDKKKELLGTARAEDLWQESKADGILMLGRVTGYQNKTDGDNYKGTVSGAMIFHRKTNAPHIAIAERPDFVKRPKGTGKSEKVLSKQLVALRRSLIKMMSKKGFNLYGSILHQKDIRDDYRCINWPEYSVFYGMGGGFCDAQPEDVSFSISMNISPWMDAVQNPEKFKNPTDKLKQTLKFLWNDTYSERVFVNIGVNHATVKNVGFNSIMMSACGDGFETPTNSSYWYDKEMIGSAESFGVGFENLFVVATSRPATCKGLADTLTHCTGMNADVMAPDVPVVSVERFYLELDTATGPLIEELLQAELLVFERPIDK
jgi:hypothetical protein